MGGAHGPGPGAEGSLRTGMGGDVTGLSGPLRDNRMFAFSTWYLASSNAELWIGQPDTVGAACILQSVIEPVGGFHNSTRISGDGGSQSTYHQGVHLSTILGAPGRWVALTISSVRSADSRRIIEGSANFPIRRKVSLRRQKRPRTTCWICVSSITPRREGAKRETEITDCPPIHPH
jgi:hypothetical protein